MPKYFLSLWISCANIVESMFKNCLKTISLPHAPNSRPVAWVQTKLLYKVCSQNLPKIYTPKLYFLNLLSAFSTHNPQGLLKQLLINTNIYFINHIHLSEV